jgi:tetratricopeptide (TPR) repeat protein/tRNA A-37 threonylcarbamoyl transferase component Bud32
MAMHRGDEPRNDEWSTAESRQARLEQGDGPEKASDSFRLFAINEEDDAWMAQLRAAVTPTPLGIIGSFELLTEVSRGGQGVVYRARRRDDQRTVALKRLLAGSFAGVASRHRFEREIEAAASLDHPGIVSVLGMEMADGQPLLAMEWIDGVPISRWARGEPEERAESQPRSVRDMVGMMVRVCQAIVHAHQRGVIHRDLKPSNILIDAAGAPHILDFGLAKMIAPNALPGLSLTVTDQFVGTPAYAAPEQFRSEGEHGDVRSDVYSLGVMFFEMLAGRLPYQITRDWSEAVETVRHVEPPRPSTLSPQIGRELDAIILKSLAKDPQRRYQSVEALAVDLQRYLDGEPVLAHGPSALYELRKVIRRHRILFGFLATTFALVMIGGITAAILATQLARKQEALQRTQHQEHEARVVAERTSEFLQRMLASADPANTGNRDLTVRQVLDDASTRIDEELRDQPRLAAAIRSVIGASYRSLGLYGAAEAQLSAAVEERRTVAVGDDADVAASLYDLAEIRYLKAEYAPAEAGCRDALAMQQRLFGDEHAQVARSLNLLAAIVRGRADYAAAEPLYERTVKLQKRLLGPDHADLADTLNDFATLRWVQRRYAESEAMHREALTMRRRLFREPHPEIVESLTNLALTLYDAGAHEAAEEMYGDALRQTQQLYGREHPTTATLLNHLGELLRNQGKPEEAAVLLREALEIRRRLLGTDHPRVATTMNNLALALRDSGEPAEAEALFRQSLDLRRAAVGPRHPSVATALGNLASLLAARGDAASAEAMYREALSICEDSLGPTHPRTQAVRELLDTLLRDSEREVDAEAPSSEPPAAEERR